MLTPYQFASNTPIQAIDIDGKEGETYLEYTIVNGKEKVLHRVIEVDIYVAFSREKGNNHFYSKKPKKDEKLRKKILNDLASQYIDGKFHDKDGNKIIWRFNVKTFNVDNISIEDYKQKLKDNGHYYVEGINDGKTGIKALFIDQQHLSDLPKFNDKTGEVEGVGSPDTMGDYDHVSLIQINDEFLGGKLERSHTLGHEVAHFLLRLHPNKKIRYMGDSAERHDLAGKGILHYYKNGFEVTENRITSEHSAKYSLKISFEGRENLNQENVDEFLKSIIDTGKKEAQ